MSRKVQLLPATAAPFAPRASSIQVVLGSRVEAWLTKALKRTLTKRHPLNSVEQHKGYLCETLSSANAIWTLASLMLPKAPESDFKRDTSNALIEAIINYELVNVELYIVHIDMVLDHEVTYKLTKDTIDVLIRYHKDIHCVDVKTNTCDWEGKGQQCERLHDGFIKDVNQFVFRTDVSTLEGLEEGGAGELLCGRSEEVKTSICALIKPLLAPPSPKAIGADRLRPLLSNFPSNDVCSQYGTQGVLVAYDSQSHDIAPWAGPSTSLIPTSTFTQPTNSLLGDIIHESTGNTEDLYEAAYRAIRAVALIRQGSQDPLTEPQDLGKLIAERKHKFQISARLKKLVADFSKLYQEKQEPKFLDAAMETAREAVALTGELTSTMTLIDLLATQFQIRRDKKYTNEAIERARYAIKLKVDSGGDQSVSLMKMVYHLHEKYKETRETEYLDGATDIARQAVQRARIKVEWMTYWSQDQSIFPTKLISLLAEQYRITKDKKYIREAIDCARDLVNLMENNSRGLSEFMRNMIKCFQEQYKKTGESAFQDEAVNMESKSTDWVNQHERTQCDTIVKLVRLPVPRYGKAQDAKYLNAAPQVAIKNRVALSLERSTGCEPERSLHDTTTSSNLFETSTQSSESYSLTEDSGSFSGESLAVHTGSCDARKRQCYPGKVLRLQKEDIDGEEWIQASIDAGRRNADHKEQLQQFIKSLQI